jgi:UDP-N-acetyl-D-mannosaminuronic acid dehydrogenase
MIVVIHGLGYVGLTLAAVLSKIPDVEVIGVDSDLQKVASLQAGQSYIYEPGLDYSVLKNITFSSIPDQGDVHIICVGTPAVGTTDGVLQVGNGLRPILRPGDLVVLRSTVPVGTTRKLAALLPPQAEVAYAPERTLAGNALKELTTLPQIVAGSSKAVFLFKRMTSGNVVIADNFETAEMVKLVDNCWRAWTFAFANQLAYDCSTLGLDVQSVREVATHNYPRAQAMPVSGFTGGPCLTKDPLIYASMFPGSHPFEQARSVNRHILFRWISDLNLFGPGSLKVWDSELRIGVIGRSFKKDPPTNDDRDSFSAWLDLNEINHDWWDPILKGSDWDATWRDKDLVILAHPMCVEGLKGPHLMADGGIILDLWGKNHPSRHIKVFGA